MEPKINLLQYSSDYAMFKGIHYFGTLQNI